VPQRRRVRFVVLPLFILTLITSGSLFINNFQKIHDTSLQQRVNFVASQLRAPGDPSTVATSSLGDAQTMRFEIQQALQQGVSTQQVVNLMVAQYGSSVLATPPFRGFGQLVWIAPWFVLALLFALGGLFLRRDRKNALGSVLGANLPEGSLQAPIIDPLKSMPTEQGIVSPVVEERLRDYL